jgi:hypothetical protein
MLTSPTQPVPAPDPASGQVSASGRARSLLVPGRAWWATVGGAQLE